MNGELWKQVDMEGNSLYTAVIDPIGYDGTIKFYIEATDMYNQSTFEGSQDNPLVYPAPKDLNMINSLLERGADIFDQYAFYIGLATTAGAYIFIKLIAKLARRRRS